MINSKIQKAEDGKNAGSAKKSVQTGKKVADKKEANKKQAAPVCVFENPEFGMVRTATDEKGEPWFCAKDLCDALGYKKASDSVKQHVRYDDTMKRGVWVEVGMKKDGTPAKRLTQMIFVNESGFYALVLGSKLASAVKFKDWVTSVVLPQIRKTGGYIPVHEGESEEETIRNARSIFGTAKSAVIAIAAAAAESAMTRLRADLFCLAGSVRQAEMSRAFSSLESFIPSCDLCSFSKISSIIPPPFPSSSAEPHGRAGAAS